MREHIELVYILQNRVEKGILHFSERLYSEQFACNIGVPKLYLYFPYSCKIRISVFYIREHTELVYILQNRVKYGILYFFQQTIFRAIFHYLWGA